MADPLITTPPTVDGRSIEAYLGVVSGEAILGTNVFKDFFAGIVDIVGGPSAAYEGELRRARSITLEELATVAVDLGANAIVDVDIDDEIIGGSMLMVTASGTAVRLG